MWAIERGVLKKLIYLIAEFYLLIKITAFMVIKTIKVLKVKAKGEISNGGYATDIRRTYGGHAADMRRIYGGYMADIRPMVGRYAADIRRTYGRHAADMRRTCG